MASHQRNLKPNEQALEAAESAGDKKGMADNFNMLGLSYELQGEPDKAVEMYYKALQLYKELDDKKGIEMSYAYLSNSYNGRGELDKAFETYHESRTILNTRGRGLGYASYGNMYATRGNLNKAIELYNMALQIYEAEDSTYMMPSAYTHLGDAYKKLGELDKAIASYLKIFQIDLPFLPEEEKASCYINLGLVYEEKGDENQAKHYYQTSIDILKILIKQNPNNSGTWSALGYVLQLIGQLDDAIFAYQKIPQLASGERMPNVEARARAYRDIGSIYKIKNDLTATKHYWQQSIELFKQMRSNEAQKIQERLNALQ